MSVLERIYIFDLDGTLADATHRLHLIQNGRKDWDLFYEQCVHDKPIWGTIDTLTSLHESGATCLIWTGRGDKVLPQTRDWLYSCIPQNIVDRCRLRMRKDGDHREDVVVKQEWLDELDPLARRQIVAAFEDRKRVVDMWRKNGIICYQVAEGNF